MREGKEEFSLRSGIVKLTCVHPDCAGKCIDAMSLSNFCPEHQAGFDPSDTVFLLNKPYPKGVVLETFKYELALDAAKKGLRVRDKQFVVDGRQTKWYEIFTGEMQK